MGEPSLFCVGGSQLKVILAGVLCVAGGGVSAEAPPVVEGLPVELAGAVSATVVAVVEPVPVLLADAAASIPSSPPQPASAIARLPIKDATTTRPAPNPRSALFIKTPENDSSMPVQARTKSQSVRCTSVQSCRFSSALTHEAVRITPATPLS